MAKVDKIFYLTPGTETLVHYLSQGVLECMKFVPVKIFYGDLRDPLHRIQIDDENAVLIWGDGYDHGITYFFRPSVPYRKSVDDAHGDAVFFRKGHKVGMTNHNNALAVLDPNLIELEVLGVKEPGPDRMSPETFSVNGKVIRFSDKLKTGFLPPKAGIVHKSIDLDVIKDYSCCYAFDRGESSYEDVRRSFEEVLANNRVVRFDIGGLDVYQGVRQKIMDGIKIYSDLIELYLDSA